MVAVTHGVINSGLVRENNLIGFSPVTSSLHEVSHNHAYCRSLCSIIQTFLFVAFDWNLITMPRFSNHCGAITRQNNCRHASFEPLVDKYGHIGKSNSLALETGVRRQRSIT